MTANDAMNAYGIVGYMLSVSLLAKLMQLGAIDDDALQAILLRVSDMIPNIDPPVAVQAAAQSLVGELAGTFLRGA